MKLAELLREGFGAAEDYNCAETMVYGANIAYGLGLDEKACHLAAAFGGGMAVGSVCGVISGGLMVLSLVFTETVAHQSPDLKRLSREFIKAFDARFGSRMCVELKGTHHHPAFGCRELEIAGAEILDDILEREGKL